MKFKTFCGTIAPLALLAACGDGGGGVASTPAPAPASTPTPTPPISSLTPSPTKDIISLQIQENVSVINDVPAGQIDKGSAFVPLRIFYKGPNQYEVQLFDGLNRTETLQYQTKSGASSSKFDVYTRSSQDRLDPFSGYTSSLSIFRASDAPIKLSYVTYGIWEQQQTTGNPRFEQRHWIWIGEGTETANKPTTGSATYNGIIDGDFFANSTRYRLGGTGSLTYNFADDSEKGTFNIDRDDGAGGRKPFDTITFDKFANGSDYTSAAGFTGIMATRLFGPHAEEVAAMISMEDGSNGAGVAIFVGKK